MSRTGENIYKRKDGRWEARYVKGYREDGKIHYGYLYSPTYREVKSKLFQANAASVKGKRAAKEKLGDFSREWLAMIRSNVKHSTYCKYSAIYKKHLALAFSQVSISKITNECVQKFILQKLNSGLSEKTVKDICSVLRQILRYAEEQGKEISVSQRIFRIKQAKKEVCVLSPEDRERLTQYLLHDLDLTKLGILVCLYTGLRVGELCALQWKDIDLEEGILSVTKTVQRLSSPEDGKRKSVVLIGTPKSNSSIRNIPLPPDLASVLKEYRGPALSYLLSGEKSCVEPRLFQYRFRKHMNALNLSNVHPHTLRHTFATNCIELGFDPKTLSEILGHSSVNITLNRYVHSSLDLKREQMKKLMVF